jgi:hypothetical protein
MSNFDLTLPFLSPKSANFLSLFSVFSRIPLLFYRTCAFLRRNLCTFPRNFAFSCPTWGVLFGENCLYFRRKVCFFWEKPSLFREKLPLFFFTYDRDNRILCFCCVVLVPRVNLYCSAFIPSSPLSLALLLCLLCWAVGEGQGGCCCRSSDVRLHQRSRGVKQRRRLSRLQYLAPAPRAHLSLKCS